MSNNNLETQIALSLRTAKNQLATSQKIANYPDTQNKKNFDPSKSTDSFYMSACNAFFHDGVLILNNLLDDDDDRVISLWNWQEFVDKKSARLQQITDKYEDGPLIQVRHNVIAHQNQNTKANRQPNSRRQGIVNQSLIGMALDISGEAIDIFREYAKEFSRPYSKQYFDSSKSLIEVEEVLKGSSPNLTENDVI